MDKKDQAAVVLAGGSSRRMGYDKAFIKLEGVEMLKRIVDLVYSITSEVIVVIDKEANPDRYRGLVPGEVKIINDLKTGQNPLIGVYSGLSIVSNKYALLIPCDVPFLNRGIIQLIFERSDGHQAAVPRWPDGRIEPLMSVYRAHEGFNLVKKLVGKRSSSMNDFVDSFADIAFVEIESLRHLDNGLLTFSNVNTPEDLRKMELVTGESL